VLPDISLRSVERQMKQCKNKILPSPRELLPGFKFVQTLSEQLIEHREIQWPLVPAEGFRTSKVDALEKHLARGYSGLVSASSIL
jgi:hypothetical protein